MSEQGAEQPAAGPLAAVPWSWVAILAVVIGATLAAPLAGVDPGSILAAVAAVLGTAAAGYARKAAHQTNGSLEPRMEAAAARAIARALDGEPPAAGAAGNPYAPDGGNPPDDGQVPYARG